MFRVPGWSWAARKTWSGFASMFPERAEYMKRKAAAAGRQAAVASANTVKNVSPGLYARAARVVGDARERFRVWNLRGELQAKVSNQFIRAAAPPKPTLPPTIFAATTAKNRMASDVANGVAKQPAAQVVAAGKAVTRQK